ncbi:hypothetical protein AVEN_138828-1 [Araneus ventricosus]|uniref:Uncharacterized protein n=1 Tax=Araneus ventricosus TaxID=182803 RepID=A0A4Y2SXQ0_ARAVE|nr:hypothetical protein AVEN_138828-1 [Araneus ventricosus]
MDAPYQPHNRSLQSPGAIVLTPPSAFLREFHSPSPFCCFRFCEIGSFPFPHDRIPVLRPKAPNGKRDQMKIQTFRPYRANSHWTLEQRAPNGVERRARKCPA